MQQCTALVKAIAQDDKGKGKGLTGDPQVLLLCTWLFEQVNLRTFSSSSFFLVVLTMKWSTEHEAVDMWRSALASVPDDLNLALEGSYYYLRVSAYEHLQEVSLAAFALGAFAEVYVLAQAIRQITGQTKN